MGGEVGKDHHEVLSKPKLFSLMTSLQDFILPHIDPLIVGVFQGISEALTLGYN